MFIVQKTPIYWWPVTVEVPSAETPGEFEQQTFQVQFENIGRSESRVLRDELTALRPGTPEYETHEDDLIRRVLRGWRDIAEPSGLDVPFSPETFAALWENSWFRIGMWRAWQESISGEKARLGN